MTKLVLTLHLAIHPLLHFFLLTPLSKNPSPPLPQWHFLPPKWRQRLAELVLEHVLQVSDVELRREDASSSGGGGGGGLGGLREAQPEGVPEALEVSLGVVDALPQRVESGHVKHSLGLLWVHLMDAVGTHSGVSWLLTKHFFHYHNGNQLRSQEG